MKAPLVGLAVFVSFGLLSEAEEKAVSQPVEVTPHPAAAVPEVTGDGWDTASMQSAGFDGELMEDLLRRVRDGVYKNTHAILVIKSGKLIFEEYFSGEDSQGRHRDFNRDTLHSQQSVTKSVNSILVGIAIDQHLISGVDAKVSEFFPDRPELFAEMGRNKLSLKDCLAMSAGLAWLENGVPYTDSRNEATGLNRSPDPIGFVFNRPSDMPPGRKFLYNSGLSIVLGEVVKKASGMPVDKFAERHLFGPLGITNYFWGKLPNGSMHTGGGLYLRPRDMAKLGYLFLNGGRWQGKQIVSEEWVRESTKQQAPYRGYGYQWWLHTIRLRDRPVSAFAAQGHGGQFIFVIPDLELVAVFTSWNVDARTEQPFEMLQKFILPAAEGMDPRP